MQRAAPALAQPVWSMQTTPLAARVRQQHSFDAECVEDLVVELKNGKQAAPDKQWQWKDWVV
jgi:hypothetical protein